MNFSIFENDDQLGNLRMDVPGWVSPEYGGGGGSGGIVRFDPMDGGGGGWDGLDSLPSPVLPASPTTPVRIPVIQTPSSGSSLVATAATPQAATPNDDSLEFEIEGSTLLIAAAIVGAFLILK